MNNPRLYQSIVNRIVQDIEDGCYHIGDKLPPERDLAEMLKVSRTSVREAIIALEVSGIVEVKVGSGVYVLLTKSAHSPNLNQEIHPLLQPYLKSNGDVAPFELLEARLYLEPHLAEIAAMERTDEQMEGIKQAYIMNVSDNLEHSKDHIGDRLFHIRIAEASQNAAYVYFLEYLLGQQYTELFSGLQKLYTPEDMPLRSQIEHHQILVAIEQKQPDGAHSAMANHIQNVINIFSRKTE